MRRPSTVRARLRRAVTAFLRDEGGSLSILTLGLVPTMVVAGGMAVDYMHVEATRVRMQATLDRAVLASAALTQTRDPEEVVRDYFQRAGLGDQVRSIEIQEALNFREVSATASLDVDTYFLRIIGYDTLTAAAAGTAIENHSSVEISLVLDVSGSMAENQRLPRLKTAASNFVDTVLRANRDMAEVSISVVPFSTQVSAGPEILQHFDRQYAHERSHCLDFAQDAFRTTGIDLAARYVQTGHFDPFTYSATPIQHPVCFGQESRRILFHSSSADALKDRIGVFWAQGNTSIDLGVKWGTWLLDPSSRSVVDAGIAAGSVSGDFAGRPLAYDEPEVMKVLIVMSDGANTTQYGLRDAYAAGESEVWRDPDTGRTSARYADGWSHEWYYPHLSGWSASNHDEPYDDDGDASDGEGDPVRLSYPELWADYSVAWHDNRHRADGNPVYGIGAYEKDSRTREVCDAAKAAGIIVFTIGFEAGDHGDDTLRDCASSPAHFFDVEGLEIDQAFRAISSTINRLRLSS